MADHFDRLIDPLIEREGGYVDNPDDKGGPTKFGITQTEARRHGYTGAMRDLPRPVAIEIYRKRYWTGPGFDRIAVVSLPIAEELFDTGVNMGVDAKLPQTWLQRSLNILNRKAVDYPDLVVDGLIGSATVTALTALLRKRGAEGVSVVLKALNGLQAARYIELAEKRQDNETFAFGWLANRVGIPA